jgi:hypothetical protein
MKTFGTSKSYAVVQDGVVVAIGNKQEMRRYRKLYGGQIWYSPGVQIGHRFN